MNAPDFILSMIDEFMRGGGNAVVRRNVDHQELTLSAQNPGDAFYLQHCSDTDFKSVFASAIPEAQLAFGQ